MMPSVATIASEDSEQLFSVNKPAHHDGDDTRITTAYPYEVQ